MLLIPDGERWDNKVYSLNGNLLRNKFKDYFVVFLAILNRTEVCLRQIWSLFSFLLGFLSL